MSMQKRLKHLESLVKDVMHAQVPGPHTPPRDELTFSDLDASAGALNGDYAPSNIVIDPHPTIASGQVHVGQKSTTYIGATHWAAILDDVRAFSTTKKPSLTGLRLKKSRIILMKLRTMSLKRRHRLQ